MSEQIAGLVCEINRITITRLAMRMIFTMMCQASPTHIRADV